MTRPFLLHSPTTSVCIDGAGTLVTAAFSKICGRRNWVQKLGARVDLVCTHLHLHGEWGDMVTCFVCSLLSRFSVPIKTLLGTLQSAFNLNIYIKLLYLYWIGYVTRVPSGKMSFLFHSSLIYLFLLGVRLLSLLFSLCWDWRPWRFMLVSEPYSFSILCEWCTPVSGLQRLTVFHLASSAVCISTRVSTCQLQMAETS